MSSEGIKQSTRFCWLLGSRLALSVQETCRAGRVMASLSSF